MIRISPILRTTGFVLAALGSSIAFGSGPPAGFTGGGGEANCTACHSSFPVNTGPAVYVTGGAESFAFTGSALITADFTSTPSIKHGFQMAVRDSANALVAGWTVNNTTVQKTATYYVNHTFAGTALTSWNATLTPSAMPAGPATLYAAGNQTNNNGAPNGDYIYTTSHKIYQAGLSAGATWPLGSLQALNLSAPTRPGDSYVLALSELAGSTALGGVFTVPVNLAGMFTPFAWDPAFSLFFTNFIGALDGAGAATASMFVPAIPALSGMTLHLAYATVNSGTLAVTEVSNAVNRTL